MYSSLDSLRDFIRDTIRPIQEFKNATSHGSEQKMTRFWITFLLAGLLSCDDADEEKGHIDLGIYYGVPTTFVDQIVDTTQESGEEVRELGESFEPCFGDTIANSTADWIIVVVNSTAKCPSSQPDNVLLLQYDVKGETMIVPDSSMDLLDTIRDFLGIGDEEFSTPPSIFTPSFIALIALFVLAIALNACCLLSKRCKRITKSLIRLEKNEDRNSKQIRDAVCPCLKKPKAPIIKADNHKPAPLPTVEEIASDTTTSLSGQFSDGEDEDTKIDRYFKDICNQDLISGCSTKCKNEINVIPCIPPHFAETNKHVPSTAPFIFTPLIVLVTSLEKRIANTRHAVKDQIVGVYHYDPPNENKLKFHLSDFKKYVRTVRGEKYQSPYLAATLKELLRVVTHDKEKYDEAIPLIKDEIYPKLYAVMITPQRKEESEEQYKKRKKGKYIKILTQLPEKRRDTLAYLMLHLYRVVNEPVKMDLKRICWELYPSVFGLRKVQILESEISNPVTMKEYRDVFMELLELGEQTWRRFFIYKDQTKCTIIAELPDNTLKKDKTAKTK
uniref:Rho-GAP domain-containing protein n=1 Tax=Pristionchus pacificus TaxID=54126 RepID=A0A8R1YSQ7_PRIPA